MRASERKGKNDGIGGMSWKGSKMSIGSGTCRLKVVHVL